MLVLLLIFGFVSLLSLVSTPLHSALVVRELHHLCEIACPRVAHTEYLLAVVCGNPLPARISGASFQSDFVKTGLIHLLVVSGSHLICLEEWVRFSSRRAQKYSDAFVFSALVIFTAMTLASPPVLRAFVSWSLNWLSLRFRLSWTRVQIVTVAGFATLCACRTRWDFASLGLSWVAALAIAVAGSMFAGVRRVSDVRSPSFWRDRVEKFRAEVLAAVRTHAVIYVTLIPALLPLGVPSSFSILCNLVFGPVMGFILFPVSLLGFAGFASLADHAWSIALWCVSSVARFTPAPWNAVELSPLTIAPYIFGLTGFLFWRERRAFVLLLIFFVLPASADELIVWNIGQGSWATLKSPGVCEHFDMGGEWAPRRALVAECSTLANEVYFSHWDWDHIGLARMGLKALPNLCVRAAPGGAAPEDFKLRLIEGIPRCAGLSRERVGAREIFLSHISADAKAKLHGANDFSNVFIRDRVVFPGDSPAKDEKRWREFARDARILIAGHHGSKSATSDSLLESLTSVREIVASAHKSRYGHPHSKMLARARAHLRPVVTTEDWGSLHFKINGEGPRSANARTGLQTTARPAFRSRVLSDDTHRASR